MEEQANKDPVSLSDLHEKGVKEIAPLITGFENVNRGDLPATAPADVEWFLNLQTVTGNRGQMTFLEQVRAFAPIVQLSWETDGADRAASRRR